MVNGKPCKLKLDDENYEADYYLREISDQQGTKYDSKQLHDIYSQITLMPEQKNALKKKHGSWRVQDRHLNIYI